MRWPWSKPVVSFRIDMPNDGWDDREVLFTCEFCDRVLVHRSVYLNMDALIQMGETQEGFAKAVHMTDHDSDHVKWDPDIQRWLKVCDCPGPGCTVMDPF